MNEFPYRLMMVTILDDHEVGFKSAEAINKVLDLNDDLTEDEAEAIRLASANGTPLFAGLDPYQKQINGFNVLIFSDTSEEVREQQEESGRNI